MMDSFFIIVVYLIVGGGITGFIGKSEFFEEVTESDEAATALGALSVLLWPLWGFAVLVMLGYGVKFLACGFVDLYRQVLSKKDEPAVLPKATARKAGKS